MKNIPVFLTLLIPAFSFCQTVTTVAQHPRIVDGMHIDSDGFVYTTPGGLMGGDAIGRYDPESQTFDPQYAEGFFGGIDIDELNDSILIVTNYDNSTVYTYNKSGGFVEELAEGLDGPAGIAVGPDGSIFITNYGAPPSYDGNTVNRLSEDYDNWVYIESDILFQCQAIAYNGDDELVLYSNFMLYKVNPADSTLEEWANVPSKLNNMVYRNADSSFYATSLESNKIYRIDSEGAVSVFAGGSAGFADGPVGSSQFFHPLGIAITPDETQLYVSESGPGRLRRIDIMSSISGLNDHSAVELKVFPNPSREFIRLASDSPFNGPAELFVYDATGKRVLHEQYSNVPAAIQVGQLPDGLYYLMLQIPSDSLIGKFSVLH